MAAGAVGSCSPFLTKKMQVVLELLIKKIEAQNKMKEANWENFRRGPRRMISMCFEGSVGRDVPISRL